MSFSPMFLNIRQEIQQSYISTKKTVISFSNPVKKQKVVPLYCLKICCEGGDFPYINDTPCFYVLLLAFIVCVFIYEYIDIVFAITGWHINETCLRHARFILAVIKT